MKRFTNSRKFLFGLSVSMVLAMAIGSFALSESQTPASPQEVETQNAVGATAGAFTVNGGTQGTDYEFTGTTGTDGVLKIHPQSIGTNITISNSNTEATTDRIEVTSAATITLAGVNISTTGTGAALKIQDDATFNVNILLKDGSNNILEVTHYTDAGLQKNGSGDNIGTLTIGVPDGSQGTGKLEATGGTSAAGIGGGEYGNGSKITINGGVVTANGINRGAGIGGGLSGSGSKITINGGVVTANGGWGAPGIGGGSTGIGDGITINGGVVTATGGYQGAGIGGGNDRSGSNITINGGVVTAYGGRTGAGIGGGFFGNGSNITINGGVVTATGGYYGVGIGGSAGSGSGNSLNGNAVVLATSGSTTKAALEGFVDAQQQSLLTQGIAFTGLGTAFDSDGHATDVSWDESGTMYGDSVTISQNVEFPADLTIGTNQSNPQELIVDTNVTLTISAGATLQNEGTLTINGTVTCQYDGEAKTTGKVTTKTYFYREGSTDVYAAGYQTYQTNAGVQKYTNLPNTDDSNDTVFDSWFTKPGGPDGGGTKVDENTNVLLNEHNFYEYRSEEHEITITQPEHGTVTTDPENPKTGDEVIITVTPEEGYEIDGLPIVKTEDGRIIEVVPTGNPNEYKFIMPNSDVTIEVHFVLISEPTVDPGVKTGDSFAGIAALAILGLATTGAVLVRKRK